jgi:hypothetical protein
MQSREMAGNSGGDTGDHRSYDAGAARRVADEDDAESENDWRVRMVTKLSLGVNVLLLVIKTIVLVSTGSLAVLAGTIDSCLDIFSCTVIFLTNRYMSKTNRYLFPMGEQYMPHTTTATATATTPPPFCYLCSLPLWSIFVNWRSLTLFTLTCLLAL